MKINDVLVEGWQDALRSLFGRAVNAFQSGDADADQVIKALAKQAQQQWVRMVANLRRNYKDQPKVSIPKQQLAAFLMQMGAPLRVGKATPQSVQVKQNKEGAPAIHADSKKMGKAFMDIYNETTAGRESGAGVYNALVAAMEEAVSETQRKAFTPYAQPGAAQQPAADYDDRTNLDKYHGKPLSGTEFEGLVDPESPEYANAIIPIEYVAATYRAPKRRGQDGEHTVDRVFVRYNGKWYIDSNDHPDELTLSEWTNERDIEMLTTLIGRVSHTAAGMTITHYPETVLVRAPYGSRQMWMQRHGKLNDQYAKLSLQDALRQAFKGQKPR